MRLAPVLVLLTTAACGPVRPGLDPPGDANVDALDTPPETWRAHLLSDVRAPTEPDAASVSPLLDANGRSSPPDASVDSTGNTVDSPEEDPPPLVCGDGIVEAGEECDDGRANSPLGRCLDTCRINRCDDGGVCFCGDGEVRADVEECDDRNPNPFDGCSNDCKAAADHLLITEVVTRPSHAEMIEIMNPTQSKVSLSDYGISDSHFYYKVATGTFTTASGTDFAARFPEGATISPGQYVVVSLGNAWGGSVSYATAYGKRPDFEMRPTANGADDDPGVPDMRSAQATQSIGSSASLTDGGEPVVLFYYAGGALVSDVDYLFYGAPSASNAVVDKTAVTVDASAYRADTDAALQHAIGAPTDSGSIHRCVYAETGEVRTSGNGLTGHDETSEDPRVTFALGKLVSERTPGEGPPPSVCR